MQAIYAGNEKMTGADEAELRYLRRISERSVSKILALDTQSIAIRHELELKRRGFALLAELSVSLRNRASSEGLFISAARRINSALSMQRTAVLTPETGAPGRFRAAVLQGYPQDEARRIASLSIEAVAELLSDERAVLVTGADPAERLAEFRRAIGIPYMIASPTFFYDNSIAAILITGRTVEQDPFLSRLMPSDAETVQAVSSLLGAVLVEKQLKDDLRKALGLAEQSSKAKGAFLANVSHEVHTPMNAILGMARMLSGSALDARQMENVEQIARSARFLLRIFDDILDFSSLDAGNMTLQTAGFSIRGMAGNIRALMEEPLKGKPLSFEITVGEDVPDTVLGDQAKVEQILLNLTENAVKFTDAGHVRVRVAVLENASGREKVRLMFEVEDTGIGISETNLAGIFSPFTQADGSYTRRHGGAGLGLAICQRMANLMHGEIQCESRPGEGSKFTFTASFGLPKETPEDGGDENGGMESFNGLRVLLVEDNEVNQLVAADILSGMGVDAEVAANGVEALKALENNEYDFVLMDIQMPEMDGLTAAAHIRANPKYKDLPIVALTAHSLPEDREASLKSGMNDHLTKPIDPEQLYAALRQWSGRRRG